MKGLSRYLSLPLSNWNQWVQGIEDHYASVHVDLCIVLLCSQINSTVQISHYTVDVTLIGDWRNLLFFYYESSLKNAEYMVLQTHTGIPVFIFIPLKWFLLRQGQDALKRQSVCLPRLGASRSSIEEIAQLHLKRSSGVISLIHFNYTHKYTPFKHTVTQAVGTIWDSHGYWYKHTCIEQYTLATHWLQSDYHVQQTDVCISTCNHAKTTRYTHSDICILSIQLFKKIRPLYSYLYCIHTHKTTV